MNKDGLCFFGTFQPPINWCEKSKKFAVFIISARYSKKIMVYILIHLIENARGAIFIRCMCRKSELPRFVLGSLGFVENEDAHPLNSLI